MKRQRGNIDVLYKAAKIAKLLFDILKSLIDLLN